jgi:UPF0755 protein
MTDETDPRPNPRPQPSRDESVATPPESDAAVQPEPASTPEPAPRPEPQPELVGAGAPARGGLVRTEPEPVVYGYGYVDEPAEPLTEEWVRLPRRSGPLRRATIVLVVLGLIVGVTGFSVMRWLNNEIHPPGDPGAPVEFTIESGSTTNVIANNLAKEDIIGNATVFRYWLRRQGGEQTFKAGDYDLLESMDYPDLLEKLRAGPKPPVSIDVTVLPGLTLAQMKVRLLADMPGFDAAELDQALARTELDKIWVPARNIDGSQNREGMLFPDTYSVDEESASNEYTIVKRMSDQMDAVLAELNAEARAAELGVSLYDIVIIASLIEEEAKIDEDRPRIARVIYNRLDRGTPLGIDATTRYETGKIAGEPLLTSDFERESPYNTRKYAGLPPTPIALPTRASLEAALNPTPNERWMYYVLTNEGGVDGAHRFVNTAREFEQAKQVCIDLGLGCG